MPILLCAGYSVKLIYLQDKTLTQLRASHTYQGQSSNILSSNGTDVRDKYPQLMSLLGAIKNVNSVLEH